MPAVVVRRTKAGFVLVGFEHGVTCSVAISDLQPRDLTSGDSDRPIRGRGFRDEPRRKRGQQNSSHEKILRDGETLLKSEPRLSSELRQKIRYLQQVLAPFRRSAIYPRSLRTRGRTIARPL
jgi:hypothetical protein